MWIELDKEQKVLILEQVASKTGLPAFVIEKDWWVCLVLKAVFQSEYAHSIIFKGGTSLSKAYHLIERFSEDIDLVIDRELLGYKDLSSKTQIKKLRKASGKFVINEFREELEAQLKALNIAESLFEIKYDTHVSDLSDPNTLEIYYKSVIPVDNPYVQQRVLLEMSARSMTEPSENKMISSHIDEEYKDEDFAEEGFEIPVVLPKRTFIEKVLLLHEEFRKPKDKIRTNHLTRHFYDLEKLMDTTYGKDALRDDELFDKIVEHRRTITPLRGMDYSDHKRGKLRIMPPDFIIKDWERDYKTMRENMIVGESLKWDNLLKRIREVENRFNKKP